MGAADARRLGLEALFPDASLEVAHCCSAAVLAYASSPPVSSAIRAEWGLGSRFQAGMVSAGSLGGDRGKPLTTLQPQILIGIRRAARLVPTIPRFCLELGGCEIAEGRVGASFSGVATQGRSHAVTRLHAATIGGALRGGLS